MNKERRKTLGAAMDALEEVRDAFEQAAAKLQAIKNDVASVRDEEQAAFDALPEGLQSAGRGVEMEEAVSALDFVVDALEATAEAMLDFNFDEALSNIDDARGAA